jgi:hypothetical protein
VYGELQCPVEEKSLMLLRYLLEVDHRFLSADRARNALLAESSRLHKRTTLSKPWKVVSIYLLCHSFDIDDFLLQTNRYESRSIITTIK